MPTNLHYRRQERRLDYDQDHVDVLLTGRRRFALPSCAGDFFDPADPEHPVPDLMRSAWVALRGQLLPKFIAEHPGCRPAAWWLFDAPYPTRQLLEGYDAVRDPKRPAYSRLLEFGVYTGCGWAEWRDPPVWETEAAYLDRHDLLTAEEVEVLGVDYATEEIHCQRSIVDDVPDFRRTYPPHKDRADVARDQPERTDCKARRVVPD